MKVHDIVQRYHKLRNSYKYYNNLSVPLHRVSLITDKRPALGDKDFPDLLRPPSKKNSMLCPFLSNSSMYCKNNEKSFKPNIEYILIIVCVFTHVQIKSEDSQYVG